MSILCLLTTPAHAVKWTVTDLGRLQKSQHCMEAASRTFQSLMGEARIARLSASGWVTFADGINGSHDALIICGEIGFSGARATLVMHGQDASVEGLMLHRRITGIFENQASRVTQAWRDSLN